METPLKAYLSEIPKEQRTRSIVEFYLRKNGCNLYYMDEDELDAELVAIAVAENGLCYDKVPEQYKNKELLRVAIASSFGMIIGEYMQGVELDEDLQFDVVAQDWGYMYSIGNLSPAVFDSVWNQHSGTILMRLLQYKDMADFKKHITHDHLIQYFKKRVDSDYFKHVDKFTDNLTAELLAQICIVNPNAYETYKDEEGFVEAYRILKVNSLVGN